MTDPNLAHLPRHGPSHPVSMNHPEATVYSRPPQSSLRDSSPFSPFYLPALKCRATFKASLRDAFQAEYPALGVNRSCPKTAPQGGRPAGRHYTAAGACTQVHEPCSQRPTYIRSTPPDKMWNYFRADSNIAVEVSDSGRKITTYV